METKLTWHDIPHDIRRKTEALCESKVLSAAPAEGGAALTVAFVLHLSNGRTAFFKAVCASRSNDYMRRSIAHEQRVYAEIGSRLVPWAPACIGAIRLGEWWALILEDLGSSRIPPWTAQDVRAAARGYAEFHRRNLGQIFPNWIDDSEWRRFASSWDDARVPTAKELAAAEISSEQEAVSRWLVRNQPTLRISAGRLRCVDREYALLHLDTRSDNIRIVDGRLRLFDWNQACIGPPEVDVAAFAQSICAEQGQPPELFLKAYEDVLPLDRVVVMDALAGISGYFWSVAWDPPSAELPQLRAAQRRQLHACMRWLASADVVEGTPLA